jgi:hypothetical protein
MSMGNYFPVRHVERAEMATTDTPEVGIAHPTVVPRNFDPDEQNCPSCGQSLSEH